MKYWTSTFVAILVLGLVTGVQAQDQSNKMKDAERRVKEQLPAEPPRESTGTVKEPTLTKPDPNRKPEPKFKEVPSPVSSDKRTREGQTDPKVKKGWDDHQKQYNKK